MTPSRKAPGDQPTAPATDDAAEGEVVVDALTGEVRTLTAAEIAAEEAEERSPRRRVPAGISPELYSDPYGEEQLDTSKEEFEAMLAKFSGEFQEFREGEIVNAKVLRVTASSVILEFGFKSEGAVPLDEFKEPPAPGTEVEVLLESLEDDDGVVVLSKKKADFLRVWEKIREAHEADRPVKGTLVRKIKGGVTVDPEQAFVGTHFETGELYQNVRFRPGIDGAFGGDFSLATLNIEFLHHLEVGRSWSVYQGGGPAVVFMRQNNQTSTHAGWFFTFGFAHENGFFTDFKLGTGRAPTLKFGVGFTVRKRNP